MLGEDHPGTAQSLNNMGDLLESMGEHQGTLPYYEMALIIFQERLGEEHPNTLNAQKNLNRFRAELGEPT